MPDGSGRVVGIIGPKISSSATASTSEYSTIEPDTTPALHLVSSSPRDNTVSFETRGSEKELTERMSDVTSTLTSTLGGIIAASDSFSTSTKSAMTIDEDEEQLMMRDSPKWEDEEIQTDESDQPRAIKAEIKLLVKTTELGKESIEIRSIREFVDIDEKDKQPGGFGAILSSSPSDREEIVQTSDRVFTLHRKTSPRRTPSPRFVRCIDRDDSTYLSEDTADEFNLMSQVRGKPNLACLFF